MKYPHPEHIDKIIQRWVELSKSKPATTEIATSTFKILLEEYSKTVKSLMQIGNECYIILDWIDVEKEAKNIPLDVSDYLERMGQTINTLARNTSNWETNLRIYINISKDSQDELISLQIKNSKYGESPTSEPFSKYEAIQNVKYNNGLVCLEYHIARIWNCFNGNLQDLNKIIELYRPDGEFESSVHKAPSYLT